MTIASVNPATGETVATFEPLGSADIERKLQRGAEAFAINRARSFDERAALMRKAAEILESRAGDYARTITMEMGKPITAAVAEVKKCAMVCRFYADNAASYLADEHIATDARESYVRFDPLGIVLAVMPWNFPFWQVFRFAAPALMAGNAGLLKHASNVPQSALAIEDILREAGFDRGEFQTLLIGADQVAALLDDERIKAATLTGSEPAGASVASSAAKRIKKSVLELGGSDPFVVMPSADLEQAVKIGIKARIVNNGQSCIAAKRFIVHEEIADAFEKRFVAQGLPIYQLELRTDRSRTTGDAANRRRSREAGERQRRRRRETPHRRQAPRHARQLLRADSAGRDSGERAGVRGRDVRSRGFDVSREGHERSDRPRQRHAVRARIERLDS